jgi:hypothetical protein
MRSKLSEQALEALHRIKALRKFPPSPSTTRAETKILETITLKEVGDVAVALADEEDANDNSHR